MPETFVKQFDTPAFKGEVSCPLGLYINGKFVDGSNNTTIEYVIVYAPPAIRPLTMLLQCH